MSALRRFGRSWGDHSPWWVAPLVAVVALALVAPWLEARIGPYGTSDAFRLTSVAHAQDAHGCPEAITRWARACDGGDVRVEACPAGHAIFVVGPGRVRVDVTRRPDGAFVGIGSLGASPVGEFDDWSAVPAPDRAAFDALVRCARERPEPIVESLASTPSPPSDGGRVLEDPAPTPWRIVLGGLLALALVWRRFGARGALERAMPLVALGAVVMLARTLLVPESFFHQNGHGPSWIAHALGEPGNYGPGYAQVFYWVSSSASDPDRAVFLLQGVLAALVPGAAFAIARGVGAPRALAWSAAIGIALSPLAARLSRGESYFATCAALLAIAAAVVALSTRPDAARRWNVAGACAAGLFVAQAALVHPIGWLAGALVPIVALVGEGEVRARVRLAALVCASIAAVVVAIAGVDLLAVITGPLGEQWLGPASNADGRHLPTWLVAALGAAALAIVIAVRSARWRRAALALAALCAVFAVSWWGELLGAAAPWVHDAYALLYVGPALAAAVALLRELIALSAARLREETARWIAAAMLLGAALAWHAAVASDALTMSTDVLEADLWRRWRASLPEGAVVAHLERADRQIVSLPLYEGRHVRFFAEQRPADLTTVGRDVFLYRSGLCTTERGRAYCDDVEARYDLEPVRRAVLPAVPSMEGLDYDRREVEVILYRVRDRRGAPTDGPTQGAALDTIE